jgi:hypothetical protein
MKPLRADFVPARQISSPLPTVDFFIKTRELSISDAAGCSRAHLLPGERETVDVTGLRDATPIHRPPASHGVQTIMAFAKRAIVNAHSWWSSTSRGRERTDQ